MLSNAIRHDAAKTMMQPTFLLPEQVVRDNGQGPVLDVQEAQGERLTLTLGITSIIEQESLDLTILGSPDGAEWSEKPVFSFPQKFYCGTYTVFVDLSDRPEVRYLKAAWKLNRWGRGESRPLFGFYVFLQPARNLALSATGD